MASSGIAMNVHYCMGKQAAVELYKNNSHKCNKCGMKPRTGGCCRDEHKFYKLSTEYKDFAHISFFVPAPVPAIPGEFWYKQFLAATFTSAKILNNSPPHLSQPDAGIRNCVFRI